MTEQSASRHDLLVDNVNQARLWSDSSGKFRVKAESVSPVDHRQVRLRRTDTQALLTVPKSQRSRADQEFLRHAR